MLIPGLLLLLASGTQVAEPAPSRASLRQNLLCFDSSFGVDWETTARRAFKTFPVDDPPRQQLRHDDDRAHAYFAYTAPIPESLSSVHFYLLSESGVVPITPRRLHGTIRYPKNAPHPEPEFFGEICLPKPERVADAGFVFASDEPIEWSWRRPATIGDGRQLLVRLASGASRLPPPEVEGHPPTPKALLVITGARLKDQYLFVRRVPDTGCSGGCCEFAYDLYRWEPGLPRILWSAYGCDI